MALIAQDFITEFHNLPGETVKSKHQNLFQLLNKNRSLTITPAELDIIAKSLKPINHLEKILRTDFLIYFQRFDELYADFRAGDEITVRKLSKQDWFFQKAFKEISCEEFVNTVLPSASYSLKLKILKKLPVDEERVDNIFDAVCKRYGTSFATVLVPKCTVLKIHTIFTSYPIRLTVAQLKVVFHKDPNLIDTYLEECKKFDDKYNFSVLDSLFKYIAQENPKVFTILFEKYELNVQLGRRTTKRFMDSQASHVSENAEDYFAILNKSVAVRRMGKEIKSLLFKDEYDWMSIIKYYPKNQRFAIFESTYNSVHHQKFGEDIDDVTEEMLKLIPDKHKRDALAKQKLEKDRVTYLKYVTPEECLKEVMEKLNHIESSDRANYIAACTECCLLNKDLRCLLKICEVVSVRLKNDDSNARYQFLVAFLNYEDNLDILEDNHWRFVVDVIVTAHAKSEWTYGDDTIMLKYVRYLVKNNKSLKEIVPKYHKWLALISYTKINKDPKSHKMLLAALVEAGPTDKKMEEYEAAHYDCELAHLCKEYNEQNRSDVIDIFDHPRLIKSVKRVLEEESEDKYCSVDCRSGIKYFICRQKEHLQEFKNLYFQKLKVHGRIGSLMWFVKHDPKTLQDNFDNFLTKFAEGVGLNKTVIWKFLKKYTHLGLDKRTVEFCKQKLGEEGYKHKEELVKALTVLASPPSHIEFIKAYVPVAEKVDLSDNEIKDLYDVQGKIVRFLHYLKSPVEVLNATFDFCKGDYLSFALAPLYSCICNLPEADTKLFIRRLDEIKALSPRKHGLHLSCIIYDTKTVHDCLKTATVPSLMATVKYFAKNPSDNLWEILEATVNSLSKTEAESLKWALNVRLPLKYRSRYIEIIWKVVEKYDNKDLRKILKNQIDKSIIENFNTEFAFDLMKRCIFKFDSENLIANLILYLKTDEKFSVLSDILSKFKTNCYNHPETRKAAHQTLNNFILHMFTTYMNDEDYVNHELVSQLLSLLMSIFSLSEALQESVMVQCMALKEVKRKRHSVMKDETVDRCSKVLVALNNDICKEFGAFAADFIVSTLHKTLFIHMFTSSKEKVRLCQALLWHKQSVHDYLLILGILPEDNPKGECLVQYDEIYIELSRVPDAFVQLQFHSFTKLGTKVETVLNWEQP